MSFDRFLLAVESRDLSQADKSIIRVSSFPILQNFNFWMIKFTVIPKKTIWHMAIWQNWCFGEFYHSTIEVLKFFKLLLAKANTFLCQFLSRRKLCENGRFIFQKIPAIAGFWSNKFTSSDPQLISKYIIDVFWPQLPIPIQPM